LFADWLRIIRHSVLNCFFFFLRSVAFREKRRHRLLVAFVCHIFERYLIFSFLKAVCASLIRQVLNWMIGFIDALYIHSSGLQVI
jgi:hypothetical protein